MDKADIRRVRNRSEIKEPGTGRKISIKWENISPQKRLARVRNTVLGLTLFDMGFFEPSVRGPPS